MKKTILILAALLILLIPIAGTQTLYETRTAYADGSVSGVYLLGTTSMDGDSSRLFFSMNFYSSGTVGRSCVSIYEEKNGILTDSGRTVDFTGKIKRVRYGFNCLFVHIGDTLYFVDISRSDSTPRAVLLQKELLTFEADEQYVYCVFDGGEGELTYSKTSVTSFADEAYKIPFKGSLLPFSSVVDIHANDGKLYILDGEGKLLIRDVMIDSDVIVKDLELEGSLPEKIVSVGSVTFLVYGAELISVPKSSQETVRLSLSEAGKITVGDVAASENRIYVLDTDDSDGTRDIKEFVYENGTLSYAGVALGNCTLDAELPNFSENTFSNAVISGKYEIVYALSYPSNVVYTHEEGGELYLKGQVLSPDEPVLILNYDTAREFYLIVYKGKLGYIVKNDATLSVAHDLFKEIKPDVAGRYRKGVNQTLTVFSVPSSGGGNAFGRDYPTTGKNSVQVQVLYELQGFDSDGVKWVYAYYRDENGLSRYCFVLSGDLTDSKNGEVVYTLMKASPDFGKKLRVYESDSALSAEVAAVPSGTQVKVYESHENPDGREMCFVKVEVGGKIYSGYVFADKLVKVGELSSNEKVAIGLAILAVSLVAGVIVLVKVVRKKSRKAPDITSGASLSEKPLRKNREKDRDDGYGDDIGF